MTGFIRVLLIFALIYFIVRILFRYVLPFLLKRFINRKMEEMSGRANNYQHKEPRREGEITVDYKPSDKKKRNKKNTGDYVDFEEIKE